MYGVNLAEDRLVLPVPVYQMKASGIDKLALREEAIIDPTQIEQIPFFALDRKIDHEAIVPIYQNSENRLVTSNDGQDGPLFYAIHPHFEISTLFAGSWELKIGYKSFDNSTGLKLLNDHGIWKIESDKSSFQFTDLAIVGDSISMNLSHEGDDYALTGHLLPGAIKGSTTNLKHSGSAGTWEAIKTSETWWGPMAKNLIDLFEYENRDGTFSYHTTLSEKNSATKKKSPLFCKVWVNPYKNMPFDFIAQPVEEF
jgi:hypothetical protein